MKQKNKGRVTIPTDVDVIINVGDADTAHSGGCNWGDERIITAIKKFIYDGGGFIGVGEPSAYQWEGCYFQLANVLGVELERGFNLNTDKYNWEEHDHFILADCTKEVDFGFNVEVHAYVKNRKYCVVNNTYEPQSTTVYTGDGSSFPLDLDANEIRWYQIG